MILFRIPPPFGAPLTSPCPAGTRGLLPPAPPGTSRGVNGGAHVHRRAERLIVPCRSAGSVGRGLAWAASEGHRQGAQFASDEVFVEAVLPVRPPAAALLTFILHCGQGGLGDGGVPILQ